MSLCLTYLHDHDVKFWNIFYITVFYISISIWLEDGHIKLFKKSFVFQVSVSKERSEDTKIVDEAESGTYGSVVGADNTSERKQEVRPLKPAAWFVTRSWRKYGFFKFNDFLFHPLHHLFLNYPSWHLYFLFLNYFFFHFLSYSLCSTYSCF